ncbi:MAG TPA: vanadium-dependent haloperoxidase [Vicinamibacterales bacterium]|nr:vanadium-dependent haloperoxidase [Vicinamibacterales bacterium]
MNARIAFSRLLVATLTLVAPAAAYADVVTTWNTTIMACTTAGRPGAPGLVDVALAHGAMHDAVQAIQGRFEAYRYRNPAQFGIGSVNAAAAAAAYGVLSGLYGAGHACLAGVPLPSTTYGMDPGLNAGTAAAQAFLQIQRPSFTTPEDPYLGGNGPGEWRITPGVAAAANIYMGLSKPFTLMTARQFRPEPPPPMTSEHYRRDYDEVRLLGRLTNSTRTAAQTDLARFWGNIGAQLFEGVRSAALANVSNVGDSARLFALAAYAAADSQFSVYETKYFYRFWRPYTAIRFADTDGNPNTDVDATWLPFLQTPAYPDHSSGANCLTAAVTTVLQQFFDRDDVTFTVSSPVAGLLTNPRAYTKLSDVQKDMVEVRIYQGIHFRFADEDGRQQGVRIGHWTFQKFLRPLRK